MASFLTKSETLLDIKVTRIKPRWHARLYVNNIFFDEMACDKIIDIGYICRTMLRWYDKGGGCSAFAYAARHRIKRGPSGKIWYLGSVNLR